MNQPNLTPENLKSLNVVKIADYLASKGWEVEERIADRATVWSRNNYEIILPLRKELRDYLARLFNLLEVLEEVENRSRLDILSDLIDASQVSQIMEREILMFSLSFGSKYKSEAPISALSRILGSVQKMVNQIGTIKLIERSVAADQIEQEIDYLASKDLKPQTIEELELSAFGAFEGSFGLKLASSLIVPMTGSVMPEILKELLILLEAGDQIQVLQEHLYRLRARSARKYTDVLQALKSSKADLKVDWGSTVPEYGGSVLLTYEVASKALALINDLKSEETKVFSVEGEMIEVHKNTRHFLLKNKKGEEYTGYIAKEAMPLSGILQTARCNVSMQAKKSIFFVSNKETIAYTILELNYLDE
jgi:hypothetical protein